MQLYLLLSSEASRHLHCFGEEVNSTLKYSVVHVIIQTRST